MESYINSNNKNWFNFRYISIGLIFLMDFNINSVDFLPDLIAVIFISAGVGRICFINDNFRGAKKYLNIFYIVAAAKIMFTALHFVFGDKNIDTIISTIVLLVDFSEMLLCILIFRKIFRGLEGFFCASGNMAEKSAPFGLIPKILNVFFTAKFLLNFIPHIPALLSSSDFDALSLFFDTWVDYSFLMKFLIPPCFIIQTFFGVFVLSLVFPFFSEVSKNIELCDYIKSLINQLLINDIFFILKQNLKSAFLFFAVGCVFFIDLQFDNINIMPDFMICVLFMTGIRLIKNTDPDINSKKLNLYLIINLFISIASYVLKTLYKIKDFYSFDDDMTFMNILKIVSHVVYHSSVIAFLLIFIELYFFIKKLQQKHLDFATEYLNKYLTVSEKNIDKNRAEIFVFSAAVFSVKTLSVMLPQDRAAGMIIFIHSMVLIIFVFCMIRGLYMIRENIYSYYN